jgi:hypothetical protein
MSRIAAEVLIIRVLHVTVSGTSERIVTRFRGVRSPSNAAGRPLPRASPRTRARQDCLKAPCLGSMISKRRNMAVPVRPLVGTGGTVSGWKNASPVSATVRVSHSVETDHRPIHPSLLTLTPPPATEIRMRSPLSSLSCAKHARWLSRFATTSPKGWSPGSDERRYPSHSGCYAGRLAAP